MCSSEDNPFYNLSGTETFKDGEEDSTIEIKIPQDTRDVTKDNFDVILSEPRPSTSIVDKNNKCQVVVENDVIPAVVSLESDEVEAKQSDGKIELVVARTEQLGGKVVVPWKVLPTSSDSVYVNMGGKSHLKVYFELFSKSSYI